MEENSQGLSSPSKVVQELDQENMEQLLLSLPKVKGFQRDGLFLYHGCWYPSEVILNVISCQIHFQAIDQEIIIASKPKSGVTWLKSLLFSIVNRSCYTLSTSPLLTSMPHQLVPFLELNVYTGKGLPDLTSIPSPRLFSTHIPYPSLTKSVKESSCRVVYLCRNPLDVAVSYWKFVAQCQDSSQLPLEECVDSFCRGEEVAGPFWDHVLGYRRESLERPDKVLFLTYEELKADTKSLLKRLAEFVGFPFSPEEEKEGIIEEIIQLCSFRNLKELEVNKTGKFIKYFESKCYFRESEVGGWTKYLTPSMAERLEKVMNERFDGSGFSFTKSS